LGEEMVKYEQELYSRRNNFIVKKLSENFQNAVFLHVFIPEEGFERILIAVSLLRDMHR
jgi:hypothetical protein